MCQFQASRLAVFTQVMVMHLMSLLKGAYGTIDSIARYSVCFFNVFFLVAVVAESKYAHHKRHPCLYARVMHFQRVILYIRNLPGPRLCLLDDVVAHHLLQLNSCPNYPSSTQSLN